MKTTLTGATASLGFLAAAATGADISVMLGMRATSSGAYVANGIAAESAVTAAAIFDNQFGQAWYGLMIPEGADSDHQAVAAFIESTTNKHIYGVTTQATGTISVQSTTDIAYLLSAALYKRTVVQYSSSSAYAVASLIGRILTTNYNSNNSTITLMYKQEPGVTAEALTASQVSALEAKNCNVFIAYNNGTSIIENGVMSSGEFIDVITGTDWLALDIQTSVYNALYTTPYKIPQTDAGSNMLVSVIESRCAQGVVNGLLAPGTWSSSGFGALALGDFMPKGFYVYATPIALQAPADRAARKAPQITVAAKLAGAIHTANIQLNINR